MKTDETKEEIMSIFYTNLSDAIGKKGWTRNQLKKASGVNLERYKAGEGSREPSLSSAVKMADALGVSLDDLLGRTEYARKRDHMTAGECIDVLLSITDQLLGKVSEDGQTIELPESNVTEIIRDSFAFAEHYKGAKALAPESFPKPVEAARQEWLHSRIDALKETNAPIAVAAYNGSYTVGDRTVVIDADENLPF